MLVHLIQHDAAAAAVFVFIIIVLFIVIIIITFFFSSCVELHKFNSCMVLIALTDHRSGQHFIIPEVADRLTFSVTD